MRGSEGGAFGAGLFESKKKSSSTSTKRSEKAQRSTERGRKGARAAGDDRSESAGGFGAGVVSDIAPAEAKALRNAPRAGDGDRDGERHAGNRDGERPSDRGDGRRRQGERDERRDGRRGKEARRERGGKFEGRGERARGAASAERDSRGARQEQHGTSGKRDERREGSGERGAYDGRGAQSEQRGDRRDARGSRDEQPEVKRERGKRRGRGERRAERREDVAFREASTDGRVSEASTSAERPAEAPRAPKASTPGSFAAFPLDKRIHRGIEAAGYTSPRPIQAASIGEILEGRDILGLAQTGTGKTAAFVLPILDRLLTTKPRKAGLPRVLIVAPTRELTNQIHGEIQTLGKFTGVKSMTIFGGVNQNPQLRGLRAKPDVLVACPGRLLDLVNQGAARLEGIEVLVLDEADHMFDMGFLPDVRRILRALPKSRQNLLYSATMPKEIRHLTKEVLTDPHVVELNTTAPAETIEHSLYPVHPTRKLDLLQHLIDAPDFKTAIVFTRTKHRAKSLAKKLDRQGHHAIALQGNMSQPQRERAMKGFKDGTFDILVATDIAARGIDVAGVTHVINYDVPNTPEAYMHRIGRTGRSEREGQAFTFVCGEDAPQVKAIEKKLGAPIERVKLEGYHIGSKNGDVLKRERTSVSQRRSGGGARSGGSGGSRGGFGGRAKSGGGRAKAGASRGGPKSSGTRGKSGGSRGRATGGARRGR